MLLRLFFAAIVTFLLRIPLLRAVGGLLLLWISWRLTVSRRPRRRPGRRQRPAGHRHHRRRRPGDVLRQRGGPGRGLGRDLGLLVFGLALTIPLIVWGSTLLSGLMDCFWWLVYLGVAVLVYVAVEVILEDPIVHDLVGGILGGLRTVPGTALAAAFVGVALWWRRARPA